MADGSKKSGGNATEVFPLWKHKGSGQWAKSIKGKRYYFGSWRTDPEGVEARKRYEHDLPHLRRGEVPPPMSVEGVGFTVEALCNQFMESKAAAVEDGDLSARTLADYHGVVRTIAKHFGKGRIVETLTPADFREFRSELAKRLNVNTLKSFIGKCRVVFNWAIENELVEKLNFGSEFRRPSRIRQQRHRNDRGPKLFHREEIQRMLAESNVHLRAMIHLGINGGLGNTDVATVPTSAIDLEHGWIDYPRPKTEVPRLIPLWPETVQALKESLLRRPHPKHREHAGLFFLTKDGQPYVRMIEPTEAGKLAIPTDAISMEFRHLKNRLGIKAPGLSFYTFRHAFETRAGECLDQPAVNFIMGHLTGGMDENYRHSISDERLRAVVDVVRDWLFSEEDDQ